MLVTRLPNTSNIAVNQLNEPKQLGAESFDLALIRIPLILAGNQMVKKLIRRPAGDPAELNVFFKMEPSIAFRDVGSKGDSSRFDLLTQAVPLLLRELLCQFVQIPSHFSAYLPHIEIFERRYRSHFRSSIDV